MKMTVDLKKHSYPIYIERGILKEAAERIAEVYQGSKIMIISDDRVYSYYGEALKKNLSEKYECAETVIPHGEPSKAFETSGVIQFSSGSKDFQNRPDRCTWRWSGRRPCRICGSDLS